MIANSGPVNSASGSHGDVSVDSDDPGRTYCESDFSGAPVSDGNAVKVEIVRRELIPAHHAPTIAVKKVRCLNDAFEIAACRYKLTTKSSRCSRECTRKSPSASKQVTIFIDCEISVADVDGTLFHGQFTSLKVKAEVSTVVFENPGPDYICIEHTGSDVVGHDGAVHCDSQPKGLSAIIRIAKTVHVPLPKLIGFLVIPNIRDIKCLRAVLVFGDGDITSCGHVHDLGRVFLSFFENGMGFREPLNLLQDSSAGLIVHTGKTCFDAIAKRELSLLRIV